MKNIDPRWQAKEAICALADALANASTSFDVWFELQNGGRRSVYERVVEQYPTFFETTVISHLVAFSTLLYSAAERRRDTHNLPTLIDLCRQAGGQEEDLAKVRDSIESVKPLWIKISRIRNEVFGHSTSQRFGVNVFVEIQLLPEQVAQLIVVYKEAVAQICDLLNEPVPGVLHLSAASETEELMLTLSQARHAA